MAELSFTVDSSLLRELGEKLVETVHLALVELVKNAYDADATHVKVIFEKDENGASIIKISDDGIGMNFDAVQDYWMRIATTTKREQNLSPVFGRPLTGAKGIGRFCCRRLGAKLTMITQGAKEGEKLGKQPNLQKTVAEFPWNSFKPGTDVTEIKCLGEQTDIREGETGTTLIISEISDEEWKTRGFNWLKRQLAVMAANTGAQRKGFKIDPGFSVELIAPDFSGIIKDFRNELMNAGWGTLTTHIGEGHKAVCTLNAMGIGRKTKTSKQSFPHLKDVNLNLAVMVDDRRQMRNTSVLSKTTLTTILKEWGGVQVRYHGFRVFPYGDDDWLNIDRDRGLRLGKPNDELSDFAQTLRGVDPGRSLLGMLSMRSYVGNVEIGGKADGFEMKANREGFLLSPAVEELREFVRYSIDWATIYRDFYLRNKAHQEAEIARIEFEEVAEKIVKKENLVSIAVQFIQDEVESLTLSLPSDERVQVQKSIEKATEAISKHEYSNREELTHLRLVASASTLVLIFSHEVRSLLGELETHKTTLLNTASRLDEPHRERITNISNSLANLKTRFEDLLGLTSLIGSSSRKAEPTPIALKERIIQSQNAFKLILQSYDIEIDHEEVPNSIQISKILEAEVYAILLNILSNSIKSVIAAGGKRRIKFIAFRDEGSTVIQVLDNGLGIDPSNYEDVFIPFVADPENMLYDKLDNKLHAQDKDIVGTGSGLGLSIIREIITARNGTIRFCAPEPDWKTELEIILP